MNRREIIDVLLLTGIVLVIISVVVLLIWVKSKGATCMINPVAYYEIIQNETCNCFRNHISSNSLNISIP